MPHAKTVVEFRSYDLPPHFPMILIAGEEWHISDVPSPTLHFHNCLEIGLCESDSGIMQFSDGQKLPFRAGDVTVIAGDVPHTTWSSPGLSSKWSYLFVNAEDLLRPFFPIDALPNAQLLRGTLSNWYGIFPAEQFPALAMYAQAMQREMQGRALNYEISVRGLFLSFMTELMRVRSENNTAAASPFLPIAPALEYVNHHYMENFPIDVLASKCNMSSSHFRRVFREIMGVGALEHLNCTRIQKACSLLRMTESSILTISEMVGFSSLSSFNRHFHAMRGVSPTEWRRSEGNTGTQILKYSGWLTPPAAV